VISPLFDPKVGQYVKLLLFTYISDLQSIQNTAVQNTEQKWGEKNLDARNSFRREIAIQVSQEERAKLREGVPYVKLY